MKGWMFAGQGTQNVGMGKELFPLFPKESKGASEILRYSIEKLCLEDPNNLLQQTEYAQPAIFFVNALKFLKRTENEELPDFLCGHSLGEYNALFASGVINLYEGLRLVQKRGQEMSKIREGGMMAVIGQPIKQIEKIFLENELFTIDIANFNSYKQVVLSGPKEDLEKVTPFLEKEQFRCVPLNVSGPFHSRYMEKARIAFTYELMRVAFKEPKVRVISPTIVDFIEVDYLMELLSFQLVKPVYWTDTINKLANLDPPSFSEISPGDEVLTRLVGQILEGKKLAVNQQ